MKKLLIDILEINFNQNKFLRDSFIYLISLTKWDKLTNFTELKIKILFCIS